MSELVVEARGIEARGIESAGIESEVLKPVDTGPRHTAPVDTQAERPTTRRLDASSLESIVDRVCARYGGVREDVRLRAVQLLDRYANARVQAFVSILVEKELRE